MAGASMAGVQMPDRRCRTWFKGAAVELLGCRRSSAFSPHLPVAGLTKTPGLQVTLGGGGVGSSAWWVADGRRLNVPGGARVADECNRSCE